MVYQKIKKLFFENINLANRQRWLKETLSALPKGSRILDAGAGELLNQPLCKHLNYVSQDICEYEGKGNLTGLQTGNWDTSKIDLVCDICNIPEPDSSFDAILCSEVLEHIPEPILALNEFKRLLKPGGALILTAPFASLVHFAPYHYCTGFSRYWYEHHLPIRQLKIKELTPNGDWFSYCAQETFRLGPLAKRRGVVTWPLALCITLLSLLYFKLQFRLNPNVDTSDLACFGWHCLAIKQTES